MRIPVSLIALTFVLAEIAAFILVGQAVGVLATLGLVLLGMVVGSVLLRRQGMATLARARADMAARRVPARPLAEGAVLAVAALLIFLPGFVSDGLGLLLLIPFVRERLWRMLSRRMRFTASPDPLAARGGAVIDLDQSEYGTQARGTSPWRLGADPEA